METRRTVATFLIVLPVLLSSGPFPSAVGQDEPDAKEAKDDQKKDELKTIAEVVERGDRHEGLFDTYQDRKTGSLFWILSRDQIDKEYIYFSQTADGVVEAGHFRGYLHQEKVLSLRKYFDRIDIVAETSSFHFDETNAISRAADANVSRSVLASRKILDEDSEGGRYLVRMDDVFLSEALYQVKETPKPDAKAWAGLLLGKQSREKTRYLAVKNYPLNSDVIVEYVYENQAPLTEVGDDVVDPRNVSIQIRHTFLAMPEEEFRPRFEDPRIGYFSDRVTDLTSTSAAPYRDPISRWKLVKKNPGAALSEPVEPIVFWIENTTPVEFRDAIRKAGLRWNEAFEVAGFQDAVVIKVQPDDAEWDAGDIRYNVLRWTSSPNPPFGGYGPRFANPRTGQILGADIMLEWVFVTNRVRFQKLFAQAALGIEEEQGLSSAVCSMGQHLQETTLFGRQVLAATGAGPIQMTEFVEEALYHLVLHEIGHTLGLNHNMKSSHLHSPEELQDRERTMAMSVTGSVMDYPAINLAPPGGEQGAYYGTRPGPYDKWAIEFGYSEALDDPAAEAMRLETILSRSTDPQLLFGNDADDMRTPGRGIDPRVMIRDLSNDPITYSAGRMDLIHEVFGKLLETYSKPGASYHELRGAFLVLTGEYQRAALAVSRYVGGVYVERAAVGQEGAKPPFTPVSREDQERALAVLGEYVFAADAFKIPGELLPYLQMTRRGFEFYDITEDPKVHERILNIQKSLLDHLLHPRVLTRMSDAALYGNTYPLAEYFADLRDVIFEDDLTARNVDTFRQNLQVEYVKRLVRIVEKGSFSAKNWRTGQPDSVSYDHPSRSLAIYTLSVLQEPIAGARRGDDGALAHRRHLSLLIDRVLEAR